jgi:nicotinamide mononucleotide adenylyltransferase
MNRLFIFLIVLVFFSCSTNKDQRKHAPSEINITNKIINDDFRGIGFHVFYHLHMAPKWHYEEIFAKRWRELNPAFARITDNQDWSDDMKDKMAENLEVMKDTDTELYFTTWGTREINNYDREIDYVVREVDNLAYFKDIKGFTNLNYYCMANELSVEHWASMVDDLDRFKRVHQLFYDELNRKNLDIKLLASDASPFMHWPTIEWASENMDDITGVYGGHHYINGYDLFDPGFYDFFYDKMKWGADLAKTKNKRFIVGEFGPKQNSNIIDSVRHDACIYNNTPLEKYAPLQVAEALTAMINGGIYAASYWTFSDFPSKYRPTYINKWGVFKWEIDDFTTRPNYYSLGLYTKFLRGPAEVYEVASEDSLIRTCAVKNIESQSLSIALVNRNMKEKIVSFKLDGSFGNITFRKYVYDSENPPFNYFGDLQDYSKNVVLNNGQFTDTLTANSVIVYTSHYDDTAPASVTGLQVKAAKIENRDRNVLSWDTNNENDFCYYRIYRSSEKDFSISPGKQIATTISNEYIDRKVHSLPQYYYKVIAVDQSGNSSE